MSRSLLLLLLLPLAACGGGSTVVEPPPPPADEFKITVQPDAEDLSSAQALGWSAGIPDADVTLTRSSGASQTVRTGATGTLTVAKLTAGDYTVDARRWLSDTERARLAAGDDAIGFVARASLKAAPGGGQATVTAPASRRRSLVISEFFNNYTQPNPAVEAYNEDAYVELYNNADTTVYVDGMILARGMAMFGDVPNFPCSLYYEHSRDPDGVWTRWTAMFPGTGREYPVPPGGIVVVATDAIDHRPIIPGGLDLRSAQFEMLGIADVDNPAVPNMIDVTFDGAVSDHGIDWPSQLGFVTVLATPVDLTAMPHAPPQPGARVDVRLPRDRILDVLSGQSTFVGPFPYCPDMVHTTFDRQLARLFLGDEFNLSAQRRTAVVLPGGRKLLQHTRSSLADFVSAARSAGVVP